MNETSAGDRIKEIRRKFGELTRRLDRAKASTGEDDEDEQEQEEEEVDVDTTAGRWQEAAAASRIVLSNKS